jgi:trimeric autotransporter adhesin
MSGRTACSVSLLAFLALVTTAQAEKKPSPAPTPPAGAWTGLGQGITGANVSALAVFGAQLIAAGSFTHAGGQPARNVAAWDGNAWSALGSGLNGPATSMTVYNGQLIVAGSFTRAGGVYAPRIAAWDGASWSRLGTDSIPVAAEIESYSGRIFAGVNTTIGSQQNPIALLLAWNGSSWQGVTSFSPGVGGPSTVYITGLDVAAGKLFIGGLFSDQAGYYYDGATVTHTGPAGEWIYAFAEYNGAVYEGGYNPVVGRYNGGTSWTYDIGGSSAWEAAVPNDLEVYDDVLVVAGGLDGFVDPPNLYLITWDGANWSTLGTGVDGIIEALAVMNGRLFAAGQFSTADGNPASRIAQWSETPVTARESTLGAVKALYSGTKR